MSSCLHLMAHFIKIISHVIYNEKYKIKNRYACVCIRHVHSLQNKYTVVYICIVHTLSSSGRWRKKDRLNKSNIQEMYYLHLWLIFDSIANMNIWMKFFFSVFYILAISSVKDLKMERRLNCKLALCVYEFIIISDWVCV